MMGMQTSVIWLFFGLIFTKCSPKWNWECNTPFWEVFAHILIGKGPQIGPRFGLGKSLIQTGQNDQRTEATCQNRPIRFSPTFGQNNLSQNNPDSLFGEAKFGLPLTSFNVMVKPVAIFLGFRLAPLETNAFEDSIWSRCFYSFYC